MNRIFGIVLLAAIAAVVTFGEGVAATDWPNGAVQIYVPSKAGGFADAHARLVATYLQQKLDNPFVVVNQATGSGTVAYANVMNAKPDGYTLLMFHTSFPVACYTGVFKGDPDKDFTTIAAMQNAGNGAIVCSAKAPWNTLNDLVADAKKKARKNKMGCSEGRNIGIFPGAALQGFGRRIQDRQCRQRVGQGRQPIGRSHRCNQSFNAE